VKFAVIGSSGLGSIVFEGLTGMSIRKLLSGALPPIAIAVGIDISLTLIQKRMLPGQPEEKRKIRDF
jgi:osmoprotectant transport system permease protein